MNLIVKTKQLRRLSITESKYTVQPKTTKELARIIKDHCEENGWDSDLNFIDTSLITDMGGLFCGDSNNGYGLGKFNGDISKWDVSNVRTMYNMFFGAENFNQPLNSWDVSNVEDMSCMFGVTKSFNQPLDNWNVSKVTDMHGMFEGAHTFNQPLNNWDVSNVKNMAGMFRGAKNFNQPLDNFSSEEKKQACYHFDEVKYKKDQANKNNSSSNSGYIDKVIKLAELREKGILSDAEFEKMKADLIR